MPAIDARGFAVAYDQCRADDGALDTLLLLAQGYLLGSDGGAAMCAAVTVAWERLNPGAQLPGILLAVLTRGNEDIAA
jgi:uncharacterized oligopeptide transporter (OPT) family protein